MTYFDALVFHVEEAARVERHDEVVLAEKVDAEGRMREDDLELGVAAKGNGRLVVHSVDGGSGGCPGADNDVLHAVARANGRRLVNDDARSAIGDKDFEVVKDLGGGVDELRIHSGVFELNVDSVGDKVVRRRRVVGKAAVAAAKAALIARLEVFLGKGKGKKGKEKAKM